MEKLDKINFRREHHSRNAGLLTESDQDKISEQVLLIAGCGVGSQIALSAARIGFENFVLIDGDTVELSNINRQGFSWRDVGRPKVDALARKIKAINPHAHIRKFVDFITPENAKKYVSKGTIIFDAIDPEAALAEIAIHRAARAQNKYIIQPADLGWGAAVFIFSKDSVSFEELLGYKPHTPITTIKQEDAFTRIVQLYIQHLPEYAKKLALDLMEGKLPHVPQPVSAANILSGLSVIAAKRIALGLPVKQAPEMVSFDPNVMLDPDVK